MTPSPLRSHALPAALLLVGASCFLLGALVGRSGWQRPGPVRTAYDVAGRLNRLNPPLRVLHPALEGLSPGLYFTRTAKSREELMRLSRGHCNDSRWEGTVYCTADLANTENWDRDACRLPEAPDLLFYGDHNLIRQIAETLR